MAKEKIDTRWLLRDAKALLEACIDSGDPRGASLVADLVSELKRLAAERRKGA